MNRPNFFVVGEPKSGTTALHGFLDRHPQITMSRIKEPYHFCTDLHQESDQFHGRKLYFKYREVGRYLSLFDQEKRYKAIGESSTFYIWSKSAAKKIYDFDRDAKIIVFLRNPIDFIHSLHSHWIVETYENIKNFRNALFVEEERKNDWKKIPSRAYFPSMLYYISKTNYSTQVERFLQQFHRDQIKVIVFEDFKKDNANVYKDILHFLEVDTSFNINFTQKNVSKEPRNNYLNYIAQNVYLLEAMKKILPYKVHRTVKNIGQNILWKESKRTKIDQNLYRELKDKFHIEAEKISDLLHIDMVKKWNFI
ncbi:sulfotransferase family protein [Desulfoplanes sp.]